LRQKIERNPRIEKLLGAPDVKIYIYTHRQDNPLLRSWSEPVLDGYTRIHTTFLQAGEMVRQLKQSGVENALIILGGWNRAGYDREHVDMWPPATGAGGVEGLRELAQTVREQGYILSLHDNYQDFYPDAPNYDDRFLMKGTDGTPQLGGVWDGGLCRLICSSQAETLMNKTLDEVQKYIDVTSYYLDTISATKLYECYDPCHPLTRQEDKACKTAVLRRLAGRGLIPGGEGGTDWALAYCAYFEGLPGSAVGYFTGIESPEFGIAAPLFNLVYHDAVISYWQHGQPFGREDHANHLLHDILSAQPSSWSLIYEQWEDTLPLIRQCYELLGRLHRRTAHSQMLSHEFLTADYAVQRARYEDGTQTVVNYGIRTYKTDGLVLPPKGFCIAFPGEEPIIGELKRDIRYIEA